MNDLISREAVIDILKQSGIIVDNVRGNLIIEEINKIPTAYDVDKVVEQLKEAKEKSTEENKNISEEAKAWNEALNEAIFFVKGGGQG